MVKKKKNEEAPQPKEEEPEELPHGFVRIKFDLLQDKWRFANFQCVFNVKDPMMYIDEKIIQNHGLVKDVKLYTDFQQQNQLIYNFSDHVKDVFKTEGSSPGERPHDITVYYDFKLGIRCPLLLY